MQVQCKHCNGTGKIHSLELDEIQVCSYCMGRGHVSDSIQTDIDFIKPWEDSLKLTEKPKSLQHQEDGDHYTTMPIQPWEIIDAHNLNFYEGNIIKYLLREKVGQNRVTELKKAKHYLEHLIELEEQYAKAQVTS